MSFSRQNQKLFEKALEMTGLDSSQITQQKERFMTHGERSSLSIVRRIRKLNRLIFSGAVLAAGLLFCCPKVEAAPNRCMDVYYISAEEATELKQVAVLEAGESDVDGIAHVMQVVLNRKYSKDFPDTIEGCILEKGQFTTVKKLQTANVTEAADEALQAVIAGHYQDNDALYFESLPGKVWSSIHEYEFTYGGHDFYR